MTNCNPNKVPLKTSVNLDEIASRLPKTPDREFVSLYSKLIGELMFVSINTQPFIAHSVNAQHWLASSPMQTTSFTSWRKAWPDTKLAHLPGAHSVSNSHFIHANSMRMQIPAGRMSFRLAKALNASWSSVIMLSLVGKPRLLLSSQCLPPRQNSLPFVLALLMSRIAAKLPMNLAFYNYALPLSTKIILVRKQSQKMATLRGDLNTLSFDGAFFITISTAVLSQSKQSSAIYSLLI